jgi:Flp pilus assembly protein TadB
VGHVSWPRYDTDMRSQLEPKRSGQPILKKAAAGLVLVAIGALVIHLVIGLVIAVFWIVAVVAVIAGVVWALNTLL